MSKAIRAANDRFDKLKGEENFLINPISVLDTEIITELAQVLTKAGKTEVIEILKKYKFEKDSNILDRLMQWNLDHPMKAGKGSTEENSEAEEEAKKERMSLLPPFIKIGEIVMKSFQLTCYSAIDEFEESSEDYRYGIILNPLPDGYPLKSVPYFANEKVFFESEEKRNEVMENIKEFAKAKGMDFFDLNEKNDEW